MREVPPKHCFVKNQDRQEYVLTIDIGGTKFSLALCTLDGQIV